jgi:hypothetical protein
VPDDFVIARNPDPASALPYLLRLPLGRDGVVLKARETWPRTTKVYCHRAAGWPADAEIVERVPTRSCVRRGPAVDLVLDRGRENRSQLVFTRLKGGREAIFWQSARTTKQARPRVVTPTGRSAGVDRLTVLVDSQEKYPYRFARQQVDVVRRSLAAGDYAVEIEGPDGDCSLAAVERKSLPDLAASLTSGRLAYALAELAALPRAAVVVEERYSRVFQLEHVRPALVADALAEAQVRWPSVPIVFCEARPLAEDWTYRWLAAAYTELSGHHTTATLEDTLTGGGPLPPRRASTAEIRAWALRQGLAVADRGRLRPEILAAFQAAHPD